MRNPSPQEQLHNPRLPGGPTGPVRRVLMVVGASHHDLEPTQLDRLTADIDLLNQALGELSACPNSPVSGVVLVATCNRLEIYLDAAGYQDAIDEVTATVARAAGASADEVSGLLRVRVGAAAAAHLFTVAAGLDSMVVGEAEIGGQIGRAFRAAQVAGRASPAINLLFQSAARIAKQVASDTGLGAAGRSIASVALDIVARSGDIAGCRALIIGTGAYARVVATELRARGCAGLSVFSPSGRAGSFSDRHRATPIGADGLVAALVAADLVVTCSGTSAEVLGDGLLAAAVAGRDMPLPVVDLALHPNVSATARTVPGIRFIDLHTVAEQVDPAHQSAVSAAQDIVSAGVVAFGEHLAMRRLDPAIVALRQHISGAAEKEMSRLRVKYPSDIAAEVERALHRVTQSLLHTLTLRAKELAGTADTAESRRALHTLFGIDAPDVAASAQTDQVRRTADGSFPPESATPWRSAHARYPVSPRPF